MERHQIPTRTLIAAVPVFAAILSPIPPEILLTHRNIADNPDAYSDTAWWLSWISIILTMNAILCIMVYRLQQRISMIGNRTSWKIENQGKGDRTHRNNARTFRKTAGISPPVAIFSNHHFLVNLSPAIGAIIWPGVFRSHEYTTVGEII
ncbi:MAG: hypothetical protein D5R96_08385 [Methanocalculus sp. MSAO_Arc2]|uniref:hypothetical protein n=1 Tax=Methanocalculus sp. MSAO_Arc2 TaxID=2293855 RepID=UPI000FF65C73|nr:MAG: hypothetical protein D5R96_08385 [Methanocalculus sp. MSAO_Arc2]